MQQANKTKLQVAYIARIISASSSNILSWIRASLRAAATLYQKFSSVSIYIHNRRRP